MRLLGNQYKAAFAWKGFTVFSGTATLLLHALARAAPPDGTQFEFILDSITLLLGSFTRPMSGGGKQLYKREALMSRALGQASMVL
jgi:hypothetical protein